MPKFIFIQTVKATYYLNIDLITHIRIRENEVLIKFVGDDEPLAFPLEYTRELQDYLEKDGDKS